MTIKVYHIQVVRDLDISLSVHREHTCSIEAMPVRVHMFTHAHIGFTLGPPPPPRLGASESFLFLLFSPPLEKKSVAGEIAAEMAASSRKTC